MLDILIAVGLFLVILLLFSIPCGFFNTRMFRGINDSKPTGMEFVKAHMPVYNVCYARKQAYGSNTVHIVLTTLIVILFLMRFLAIALVNFVPILFVFSPFFVIVSVLMYYVLYAVNAVDFARMLGCGGITLIMCILVAPLGYYLMSNQVLPYFKESEDVMSDRFGA